MNESQEKESVGQVSAVLKDGFMDTRKFHVTGPRLWDRVRVALLRPKVKSWTVDCGKEQSGPSSSVQVHLFHHWEPLPCSFVFVNDKTKIRLDFILRKFTCYQYRAEVQQIRTPPCVCTVETIMADIVLNCLLYIKINYIEIRSHS